MEQASDQDLLLSSYDYDLPEELIAQTPATQREASRLMVYRRGDAGPEHSHFGQLGSWLQKGDLLVLNDTRVIPARLFGTKTHTGTRFEFLLSRPDDVSLTRWRGIAKNSKRIRPGYHFSFGEEVLGEVLATDTGGQVLLEFQGLPADGFWNWLDRQGEIPYPPYISSRTSSPDRYQTVFNRERGSVAAPTAGLHFTPELLKQLAEQGIEHTTLTLHVGLGTFTPVRTERIDQHRLHAEVYSLSADTAARLNKVRTRGGRLIAVGTTATRTLETIWRRHGQFVGEDGETDLFVYPGQSIGAIDGLITNFHLPQSSLLMLVSAWIGRSRLMDLYALAIAEGYRFYSFGDGMLLL